ncbi:uncharacterized protein AKAW2_31473S [Aspergillus luchuensis]|uniref:Uncharacterized protein n=2 Tax=Aspergillus subgen. Circumdati TaxID=2720871 RepID=A0A370BFW3_ASPNG|nr:uncharacterized protein AKAW2_31473S [Aspergillus luchuensis]RDH14317.1 hypothetical protein M747DRAFT_326891 [Aspergillus niger ATCC 13496]BCR98154.1 hypothetical protein AKAW2_31473S [Aspergillus luchuensis]GAA92848.1 hypothetical protein AKAW_10961 [Aspergillus luchuensis IFO 4308]
MPLPRPKRQRVAMKPESSRSHSTGRSLPPPDHPTCDILRLTGRLSSTPAEIDDILERIWGKREDEATLAVRARMGLPYTPLEELDRAVKAYFSDGLLVASTKLATLQQSILRGESTIILGENLR